MPSMRYYSGPWAWGSRRRLWAFCQLLSFLPSLLRGTAYVLWFEMLGVAACVSVMVRSAHESWWQKAGFLRSVWDGRRVHLLHLRKIRALAGWISSQMCLWCWKESCEEFPKGNSCGYVESQHYVPKNQRAPLCCAGHPVYLPVLIQITVLWLCVAGAVLKMGMVAKCRCTCKCSLSIAMKLHIMSFRKGMMWENGSCISAVCN